MKNLLGLLFVLLLLGSCDDGKIYPQEAEEEAGQKVTLTACFKGIEAWPEAYQLVLAGFDDENSIPLISKVISKPASETEQVSVTINGLPEEVKVVSVSIVTRGRSLIYPLYRMEMSGHTEDEITLPVSEIQVASYDRIQKQVFNLYCANCHGGREQAAAGLYLTEGKSYEALVGKHSTTSPTSILVKPEDASNSYLHHILTEDIVHYNHTDVLPEAELVTLIDTWIGEGASAE